MPRLMIDDREIDVPEGTKVIEAAERLGITIPRFCYHPAMGSVGACLVCAVMVLEGPVKGVQMSCMLEARDGMVVSTTDPEAVGFRKQVIEWLMLHHPHDCPVCDEGGHCLLQDMTVSGGHGRRRYRGKKRTHHDQDLGPLVQHEMNRCIQCYRCTRFYRDFAGYRDLGVMRIGSRVYFGRSAEGTLESPFAGNLTDLCPTGVFTDKPSRYIGRRWDYERAPSLCLHCSLGCHTVASVRYRRVVRQEARFSEAVNGHFICDRGRHGFCFASHPERPSRPRVEGAEASLDRALAVVGERLGEIERRSGGGAVGCLGSARGSLETLVALDRLCKVRGWPAPVHFGSAGALRRTREALAARTSDLTVSLRRVEAADFVLVVGVDPVNEAPMLAVTLRQAQRRGAQGHVLDPRPVSLPLPFTHVPAGPDELGPCLSALSAGGDGAGGREDLAATAEGLRASQRPIVVSGTDIVREGTPSLAAELAGGLLAAGKEAGLFPVLPGPNAAAAAWLSATDRSLEALVAEMETGGIQALLVVESDPFHAYPDADRLSRALDGLALLVVLDYVASSVAERAHVLLPTATHFESGGTFVNNEGRLQVARSVYRGGTPIAQVSAGDHPPRTFPQELPGGEVTPAWRLLGALAAPSGDAEAAPTHEEAWSWVREADPALAVLPGVEDLPEEGVRLALGVTVGDRPAVAGGEGAPGERASGEGLELLLVDWTFGTEELSAWSPQLRAVEAEPCLLMHPEDAAAMELTQGAEISLDLGGGSLDVRLRIAGKMARGTLVLPRHRRLAWRKLGSPPVIVAGNQIKKRT